MTKNFLSLVLMMALVVGLFPVMGVQAEVRAPQPYLTENFENFTENSIFNENFSKTNTTLTDNNGEYYFAVGNSLEAKIITMNGYNGEPTKVVDIYADSSANWTSTLGAGRLNFKNCNNNKGAYTLPEDGKYVMEFKIYVPENQGDEVRSFKTLIAAPAVISIGTNNVSFGIGNGVGSYTDEESGITYEQHNNYFTGEKGKWYKLTYVFEYDVMSDGDWGNAASLYVDDVLKGYREDIYGYQTRNGDGKSISLRSNIQFAERSYGIKNPEQREKEHIIFDDFNFYVPGTTTPSSNYAGYDDVKGAENITVDFDNMILESSVSSDCVTIKDSEGKLVEIDSVTASADCKSIIINPKSVFEDASEYTVTVSGLLDMYSQDIERYSFKFKTTEPSLIEMIDEPTFTKKADLFDGAVAESIEELQEGYINANFTVKNGHLTASKEVVMIAVLKEGNTIKRFHFKDATLEAGESLTFNVGFNVTDAENQSIECYTWNSIFGMTPLSDKYTITKDGITPENE